MTTVGRLQRAAAGELVKLARTRSLAWTIAAGALAAGLSALLAGLVGRSESSLDSGQVLALGPALALPFATTFGVMVFAGEVRHGTLTVLLAAEPRRAVVVAAKALSALLGGALLGVTAAVLSAAAAQATLGELPGDLFMRVLWGSPLAAALLALFGLGLALLVRNQGAALFVVLGYQLAGEEILRFGIRREAADLAERLPMTLASALAMGDPLPDPRALGAAILALWAVGTLLVGLFVFSRRDALP